MNIKKLNEELDKLLEERQYNYEDFDVNGKHFSYYDYYNEGKVYVNGIHPYDLQDYHWACGRLEPEANKGETFGTYTIYRFSPGQKKLVVRGTKEDVAKAIINLDSKLSSRIDHT